MGLTAQQTEVALESVDKEAHRQGIDIRLAEGEEEEGPDIDVRASSEGIFQMLLSAGHFCLKYKIISKLLSQPTPTMGKTWNICKRYFP